MRRSEFFEQFVKYDPVTEPGCLACKCCGATWEKQPEPYGDCMHHAPECRVIRIRTKYLRKINSKIVLDNQALFCDTPDIGGSDDVQRTSTHLD